MKLSKIYVLGTILVLLCLFFLYKDTSSDVMEFFFVRQTAFMDYSPKRLAVICYLPANKDQVPLFISLLYGSWRYITKHQHAFNRRATNRVDLLVFCHPSVIDDVRVVCSTSKHNRENCYAIEQSFEIDVGYKVINSFVMFNRTDIHDILHGYDYVIRTDYDVFLSPALLHWRPKLSIMVGRGGYSVQFNKERLMEISRKLGLRHHGVHNVGSTWFGETQLFIRLSRKAIEMTAYMYQNEFNASLPGLSKIDFKKNIEGSWPKWWRPVSLLYGAELALNHEVANFSAAYKGEMDSSSCSKRSVWETPHIHCWHNDCEFQKFKFITNLANILQSKSTIKGGAVRNILANIFEKDIRNMTIMEYSTFIAWHSVGKYLKKWYM